MEEHAALPARRVGAVARSRVATLRSSCSVTSTSLTPSTTRASRRSPGGSSTTSACLPATGWSSRCATIPSGRSRSSRAAAIGAVAVPLNAWWTGEELAFGISDCGARVVVADGARWAAGRKWQGWRSTCSIGVRLEDRPDGTALPPGIVPMEPRWCGNRRRFPRSRSHRTTTPRSSTRRARPVARKACSGPIATSAPTS